jgi:isochorismate pyruvate lyase
MRWTMCWYPLLVQRTAYMMQAARIKQDVRPGSATRPVSRAIVDRVRRHAQARGGEPAVIEAIYRGMMEVCIAYEHASLCASARGCRHEAPDDRQL